MRSHCANLFCSQILRAQWHSLPNAGSVCHRQPFPGQAARSSEKVRCPAALASEAIPPDDAQYKQPDGGLSQYDKLIIGLAVPALGSILLDPIMSLVDTGTILPTQFSTQVYAAPSCKFPACSGPICPPARLYFPLRLLSGMSRTWHYLHPQEPMSQLCLHIRSICGTPGRSAIGSCGAELDYLQFLRHDFQFPCCCDYSHCGRCCGPARLPASEHPHT